MFDKNNDLEIYSIYNKLFNIPKKYLQEIDQESLKEIRQSEFPFNIEAKGECNNNICQFEFFKKDTSHLLFEGKFYRNIRKSCRNLGIQHAIKNRFFNYKRI
ncbi:hypothetical protein [Helicobacter pylori]|uniref:hypothetical protein n=1 Tax=Helicobacter pylori TaxID=210 RepID=UPI0016015CBD